MGLGEGEFLVVLVYDEVGRGHERAAEKRHVVLVDVLETVDDDFAHGGSVLDDQFAVIAGDIVWDDELVIRDPYVKTWSKGEG